MPREAPDLRPRRRQSKRNKALGLMALDRPDDEILRETGCTQSQLDRWRVQEGIAKPEESTLSDEDREAAENDGAIPKDEKPDQKPVRRDFFGDIRELLETIEDGEVPTDLGPSVRRLTYQNIKTQERVAQIVMTPEFVLRNTAGEIAALLDVMGRQTVAIIQASQAGAVAREARAQAEAQLALEQERNRAKQVVPKR